MKGEALAFARYTLFADRAREEGHAATADLLERVALEERFEHFRELAELYGLLGDTEENLETALEGESEEVTNTYLRFEQDARAAGDDLVADRFAEIRRDEMKHEDLFRQELAKVRVLPEPEFSDEIDRHI
jgi:rubrerythrin